MRHGTCPDFQPSLLVDDGHWWPSFKRSKQVNVQMCHEVFMKFFILSERWCDEHLSDTFFGLIVQDGLRWRWALKSGELTSGTINSDFYRFLPPKFGMKHRWTQVTTVKLCRLKHLQCILSLLNKNIMNKLSEHWELQNPVALLYLKLDRAWVRITKFSHNLNSRLLGGILADGWKAGSPASLSSSKVEAGNLDSGR